MCQTYIYIFFFFKIIKVITHNFVIPFIFTRYRIIYGIYKCITPKGSHLRYNYCTSASEIKLPMRMYAFANAFSWWYNLKCWSFQSYKKKTTNMRIERCCRWDWFPCINDEAQPIINVNWKFFRISKIRPRCRDYILIN